MSQNHWDNLIIQLKVLELLFFLTPTKTTEKFESAITSVIMEKVKYLQQ